MTTFHIVLAVVLGLIALYCALRVYEEFSWRKCIGNAAWLFSSAVMITSGWLSWLSWTAA